MTSAFANLGEPQSMVTSRKTGEASEAERSDRAGVN